MRPDWEEERGHWVTAAACWDIHTLPLGLGRVRCERATGLERVEAGRAA